MQGQRLVKTDQPGYLKDQASGVIINTNDVDYMRILQAREKKKETDELASRVTKLESGIEDIKSLLQQLVNRDNNG